MWLYLCVFLHKLFSFMVLENLKCFLEWGAVSENEFCVVLIYGTDSTLLC